MCVCLGMWWCEGVRVTGVFIEARGRQKIAYGAEQQQTATENSNKNKNITSER